MNRKGRRSKNRENNAKNTHESTKKPDPIAGTPIETPESLPSLELHVADTERSDPVTPIRWCIDRAGRDRLLKEKCANPSILISLFHHESSLDVERYLIDLRDMMTYITFPKPGNYTITGLVFAESKDSKQLRISSLSKTNSYFNNNTSSSAVMMGRDDRAYEARSSLYGSLHVSAPSQLFAPPPPKWLKRWATWYWMNPATDQCDFRRRLIFSVTVQPFLMMIEGVARILALFINIGIGLFALLSGARLAKGSRGGVHLRRIFTLGIPSESIWEGELFNDTKERDSHSWLLAESSGKTRPFWAVFLAQTPIIWILCAAIIKLWSLTDSSWRHANVWYWTIHCWSRATLTMFACHIVGFVFEQGIEAGKKHANKFTYTPVQSRTLSPSEEAHEKARFEKEWDKRRLQEKKQLEAVKAKELAALTCERTKASVSVALSALPSEKRTVHLRFLELKAKICRPYQRE